MQVCNNLYSAANWALPTKNVTHIISQTDISALVANTCDKQLCNSRLETSEDAVRVPIFARLYKAKADSVSRHGNLIAR